MGIGNIDFLKPEDNVKQEVAVIENLPMYVNLGDFGSFQPVIGFASAFRDEKTGTGRIEIKLSKEHTDLLNHLVEIVDLKAVGFAGIMKKQMKTSDKV